MSYQPDYDSWRSPSGQAHLHIDLRDLTLQIWISLTALWGAKIFIALMMGASFSVINPILSDVYFSEFIPVPPIAEDITMGAIVNAGLGLATVILPAVLWRHVLSDEFQRDPKGYFKNQPIRVAVGGVLAFTYVMLLCLEGLALKERVQSSLDTGPITLIQEQPETLPLVVASIALILGTFLIGLASAALTKSISQRFGKPIQLR